MTDVLEDVTIPDSPDGLANFVADSKTRNQIFRSDLPAGRATEFLTKYANAVSKADPELNDQVNTLVQAGLAEFARNNKMDLRKGDRPATPADIRAQRQAATVHSKMAVGAKLNGEFESLWDYLEVTHPKADPRQERIGNLRAKIENAMSSTDPASGGFLIPEEFRATLMELALESAVVRPRARVIPMQSLRIAMPFVDSTSNVSSVYGGVVGYWTEEGAALVQSQPTFGRLALEAKKLTAYTEVPNELRRDSAISVETLIGQMFPAAVAWFEDIAFMFGSGAGEPLGVFNPQNNALLTVPAQGGQDGVASPNGASIVWENIVNMYARMLPSSLNSAVWVVSPATFPQLLTTALSVGTGGSLVGMAASNGTVSPTMSLLGRPVIVSEKVGNLGFGGDLNFVDFGQYLIGDRMQMESETSTDYRFGNDVTAYRFIERVDGKPWMQSPITPRNAGPTLSPYLQLAARP